MKIAFFASRKPKAAQALQELSALHSPCAPAEADVLVVLGGDGTMLRALHEFPNLSVPIYGMNLGTLGFLHNGYSRHDLPGRIERAQRFTIHPLRMRARDVRGTLHEKLAYNEVSLLRQTHSAAKIRITLNGRSAMEELFCDGVLLSTPVGSTAYNLSAGGPIVPLDGNILPLTPISAFRPRRWPGALLRGNSVVSFEIHAPAERPVSASADSFEYRDIREVEIRQAQEVSRTLLFDPDNHLEDRILHEQFAH